MVVYSFYIFDRHGMSLLVLLLYSTSYSAANTPVAECIYKKRWAPRPGSNLKTPLANGVPDVQSQVKGLSVEDDAKLVFGTIFSLRNMVRKLGGLDDRYPTLGGKESRSSKILMVGGEASYPIERVTTSCTTTKLQLR